MTDTKSRFKNQSLKGVGNFIPTIDGISEILK